MFIVWLFFKVLYFVFLYLGIYIFVVLGVLAEHIMLKYAQHPPCEPIVSATGYSDRAIADHDMAGLDICLVIL